jgi:hypothetical protein
LLGIEAGFQVTSAVEFSVSGIIVSTNNLGFTWLLSLDEAFLIFGIFVFIFALVLIIDFGIDIEESIGFVLATLSAMTLRNNTVKKSFFSIEGERLQ